MQEFVKWSFFSYQKHQKAVRPLRWNYNNKSRVAAACCCWSKTGSKTHSYADGKAQHFPVSTARTKPHFWIHLHMFMYVVRQNRYSGCPMAAFDDFWPTLQTNRRIKCPWKCACVSYLYSSTYGIVASTYPNQWGCTPRSTSSQRRRTRLTERGDRGPPPAARSNSPWSHTGRRSPLPCSPSTKQPVC